MISKKTKLVVVIHTYGNVCEMDKIIKLKKNKNFYILEINTVPGMTSHSCVPRSGSLSGLTYNDVVKNIIDASL